MKEIQVTHNFTQELIGKLILDTDYTDIQLAQLVLTPAYVQNADGTIELTEFSLIPAENAAGLINRGVEKANEQNTQA